MSFYFCSFTKRYHSLWQGNLSVVGKCHRICNVSLLCSGQFNATLAVLLSPPPHQIFSIPCYFLNIWQTACKPPPWRIQIRCNILTPILCRAKQEVEFMYVPGAAQYILNDVLCNPDFYINGNSICVRPLCVLEYRGRLRILHRPWFLTSLMISKFHQYNWQHNIQLLTWLTRFFIADSQNSKSFTGRIPG